ncbi:SSU ribosomal protein S1P [Lishizhenia tianjinensis]|uniref:Small ribosomal subunit protein bS1 n=1 Tax=Lishizhenia tianjinensis TaxID=477690 RepID=A0A1I6XJC4_9FLAO|nr:30S ribosomal protein S1 [Lishizhenia tianjinensis]SFT38246.1 SSU ribosomal protein S1P [Lishizhenia tianjinensis]
MAENKILEQGSADFDWEALANEGYSLAQKAEYAETYEATLTSINEKEVIKGTVVAVTKKEVVVNIGYKSEGVVPINEFRYNPDLAVGDEVDIYVESQEDKYGQLVVSHRTARMHSAWAKVNEVLKTGEVITGYVKCRTKGGLIVDVFGIEAFLPGSQIDVKPIRDYDIYVGKNMEFKVVKINQEFRNVVVSHKALIEAELEEQKKQIISGLEKGQVLEGTVKNITSYGVFIDLGGVDGLIHITDLSWGRVNHPEEIVELDQKLNVVILDFDDDKKRIALGLKQLQPHPWDALSTDLAVGDKVKGKVVVLADYGAFVEIAPGVEGLIHVSEMSWSQHLRTAQDFLAIGDEVEAVILTLDREERKMSLGIKQLMPDPWEGIAERYPVDSKHNAKVRNFTNFGVFVELEEGVDGLIHISDLSWQKKIKHPSEFCKVGDAMEVVVLEIDKENRRISLGHKQLEENPWDVFETLFGEGSVHQGTIIEQKDKSGIVALPYGVEGICPAKHMRKEDGSNAKVDETLDFKVIEFNKDAKKIVVSHVRTFEEGEDKPSTSARGGKRSGGGNSKAVENLNKSNEKSTLGDLDALAALKDKMEGK